MRTIWPYPHVKIPVLMSMSMRKRRRDRVYIVRSRWEDFFTAIFWNQAIPSFTDCLISTSSPLPPSLLKDGLVSCHVYSHTVDLETLFGSEIRSNLSFVIRLGNYSFFIEHPNDNGTRVIDHRPRMIKAKIHVLLLLCYRLIVVMIPTVFQLV